MKATIKLMVVALALATTGSAMAQATPEELKRLGTALTPWGADKAGNADGSIPAYTGGLQGAPASFDEKSRRFVDPFASEKPVLSIDAKNMAQYADKLTPGTQELMKRWPDYRIDVYPSHRNFYMTDVRAAAAVKNASNPECKTTADGVGLRGCWGGTPFPVPKTGYEVMWNSILRQESYSELRSQSWLVDSSGQKTPVNESIAKPDFPYYDVAQQPYDGRGKYYYRLRNDTLGPARDAGQKTLIWWPLEFDQADQRIWNYTTGQRRTRLAPEFTYDTPSASMAGAMYYDELSGFSGRMDRFDFTIVGKKEMYVPYNQYKLDWTGIDALGPKHVNPEDARFELHRVWIVKATRKEGKRHVAAERTFYIDEDSWAMLSTEGKDDSGKIFRVVYLKSLNNFKDGGSIVAGAGTFYDLTKGQYIAVNFNAPGRGYVKPGHVPPPDTAYRSESMAGSGVR